MNEKFFLIAGCGLKKMRRFCLTIFVLVFPIFILIFDFHFTRPNYFASVNFYVPELTPTETQDFITKALAMDQSCETFLYAVPQLQGLPFYWIEKRKKDNYNITLHIFCESEQLIAKNTLGHLNLVKKTLLKKCKSSSQYGNQIPHQSENPDCNFDAEKHFKKITMTKSYAS